MPEAVSTWFDLAGNSILERTNAVSQIQANLVEGYIAENFIQQELAAIGL